MGGASVISRQPANVDPETPSTMLEARAAKRPRRVRERLDVREGDLLTLRLRRRFPVHTAGGHLALSAPDRPDGHLSPTATEHGHLSPPEP